MNNIADILDSPDKRVKETNHLLAKLCRVMWSNHNVGFNKWNENLNRYYRSPFSKVKKNARDIASDKNNFNRAISAEQISWNNFFKAIMIIGPKTIEIRAVLTMPDGKIVHSVVDTENPLVFNDDEAKELTSFDLDRHISMRKKLNDYASTHPAIEHVSLRKKIASKKNNKGN